MVNWTRPTRARKNKMTIICTGPWNVWTVLNPGKMQELTEQTANTQLEKVQYKQQDGVEMV